MTKTKAQLESENAQLRAELADIRETMVAVHIAYDRQETKHASALASLATATANALLGEWLQHHGSDPRGPGPATMAHLAGGPTTAAPARAAAEQRVLDAMAALPLDDLREAAAEPSYQPGKRIAEAELARRAVSK
jgi:hypothetical protein